MGLLMTVGGSQPRDILVMPVEVGAPIGLSAVRRRERRCPGARRWLAVGDCRELKGQGVVAGAMPSVPGGESR